METLYRVSTRPTDTQGKELNVPPYERTGVQLRPHDPDEMLDQGGPFPFKAAQNLAVFHTTDGVEHVTSPVVIIRAYKQFDPPRSILEVLVPDPSSDRSGTPGGFQRQRWTVEMTQVGDRR